MKYFLIVLILFFNGCKKENISFANIEDNLNNELNLNEAEKLIAKNIIENAKNNDFKLITSKELEEIINELNLEIIAAIPRGVYNLGFIENAKNFEFSERSSTAKERLEFLLGDKKNKIVFYDNGDGGAINTLLWAKELGYKNLYYLVGNFSAWKERNYFISFESPMCCE